MPEEDLLTEVAEYLDDRRLIGTTVELKPCRYRGLSVVVNLQARPLADTARVEEDVAHALYTYLNPLVGGNPTGPGQGWPFGRALNQGELYGVVHAVDGVEFVRILRLYETNLETGEQSAKPAGTHIVLEPDELMASGPAHRQGHAPRGLMASSTSQTANGRNGRGRRRDSNGTPPTAPDVPGPGFGTLMIQIASGPKETPPVASTRAYLRNGLPALYQDGDFGMRFVGALEELLDPIVAVLDGLPYHFDPNLAPPDILELLAAWLGVDLDEIAGHQAPARDGPAVGGARPQARHGGGMELALEAPLPGGADARRGQRRRDLARPAGPGGEAVVELHRLLRQAGRRDRAGGDRALHRAVQAGAQHVPPAREGSEEEG